MSLNTYFGFQTKSNKIKWSCFGLFFLLSLSFFIAYLAIMLKARNNYEDCIQNAEVPEIFNDDLDLYEILFLDDETILSSPMGEMPQPQPEISPFDIQTFCHEEHWEKEQVKIIVLVNLTIIFFLCAMVPVGIMLCCTERPSSISSQQQHETSPSSSQNSAAQPKEIQIAALPEP